MGRRALPKIDPTLELTRYLRGFDDLPQPWDSQRLFAVEQPLEVELGSGKGLFLTAAAKGCPQHNFLGLEIARSYARFCASRLAKHGFDNAVMMAGDGLRVFQQVLPTAGVRAVHVYFPDPWWKKRHRKRRVVNGQFLADVIRVLEPGGTLHFWTDVQEYFETSLELLQQFPLLVGPEPVAESAAEHFDDYRTHFERRMRLAGKPVYRSQFVRAPGDAPRMTNADSAASGCQ